jgi:2'-5' RNA ligase
MREVKFSNNANHKKLAGTYLMFSAIEDKELREGINKYIFHLVNSNTDLDFEPQEYPHVTLFASPDDIGYASKLELISYARSILPPSNRLIDVEVVGTDLFSEDKQTLVIRLRSDSLDEMNSKICAFMSERGVKMSEYSFNPHLTLGRLSRSEVHLPPVEGMGISFKNLTISVGY